MKRIIVVLVVALAAACSSPYQQSSGVPGVAQGLPRVRNASGSSYPITHVIVVMQENRSFDNFFRGFPGADSATSGMGHGVKYTLVPKHLTWTFDLNHYRYQFLEDWDGGKNDGWDKLIREETPGCKYGYNWVNEPSCWTFWTGKTYQQMAFSYVYKADIQTYWTLASEYTLGDHNFASMNGPSYGNHLVMVTGQEGHADEVPSAMPWGCDAPKSTFEYYLQYGKAKPPAFPAIYGHDVKGANPCFTFPSIASELDAANVTWRWYKQPDQKRDSEQPDYNVYDSNWLDAFDSIQQVRYGPDYKNVVTPDSQVLSDIANNQLPQVSWVMPHQGASDHPGSGSGNCGPSWITAIVNGVGESPYWNSTAIIISWDEWGGWFDHAKPPQYVNPDTGAYEGLGYRTPLIIVSPYAKNHYVSKAQHETASSLHFIEKMFNLASLGLDDARADAYDDVFDFTQTPTTFKPLTPPSNYQTCMGQSKNAPPEVDY